VFTTNGTYPCSFVRKVFHNGQPSHDGDRKTFEVMTSTYPRGTRGSVASLFDISIMTEKNVLQFVRNVDSVCYD
jgi:hypothetical protein